jgi:hypothetical protein
LLRRRSPFVSSKPNTALNQSDIAESLRIEMRTSFTMILLREIEEMVRD